MQRSAGGVAVQKADAGKQTDDGEYGEHCREEVCSPVIPDTEELTCRTAAKPLLSSDEQLQQIGRFLIRAQRGAGAFAVVYEAFDPQLERSVALKVPRRRDCLSPEEAERFVSEARTVASLDHPRLVRIFEVLFDGALPVIVQEFVDGQSLREYLADFQRRGQHLPIDEAVRLITGICEGLEATHACRVYHRDLKPANILLTRQLQPKVTDFGLALREADRMQHMGEFAGTRQYMSPEQVASETHRIDGRADLWAVGVIFYEMLTGQLPFVADSSRRLMDSILTLDPAPPRQLRSDIPEPLDAICRRCVARRLADRYGSAAAVLEDLRRWSSGECAREFGTAKSVAGVPQGFGQDLRKMKMPRVVPRGLQAFDEQDADFFLELLPGVPDTSGLPSAVAFWKRRLESRDSESCCAVGLLHGPSGSGKSSLMKAGVLPRLAPHVHFIFVECVSGETEQRVDRAVRRKIPASRGLTLADLLHDVREGGGVPTDGKLVLVLDQFEQCLHGLESGSAGAGLIAALRQCDGVRVQAVLLLRDEFWTPWERFRRQLDLRIADGECTFFLELFDQQHARKVLELLGRGQGSLDPQGSPISDDQQRFLRAAVEQLSVCDRVISVRLSLFAQMFRGREWTVKELQECGGAGGVGRRFLDECFLANLAPREQSRHAVAAQRVLRSLLPAAGVDIRGQQQSECELQRASGYSEGSPEFESLLELLEQRLRLLTRVDRDNGIGEDHEGVGIRYYQLTHDFLVPTLREWLFEKLSVTVGGRVRLLLEQRTAFWTVRSENRHLLSLSELVRVLWWIRPGDRSVQQQMLVQRSFRWQVSRLLVATLLLGVLFLSGSVYLRRQQSRNLVQQIAGATPAMLQPLLLQADQRSSDVDPLIQAMLAEAVPVEERGRSLQAEIQLKLRLALLRGTGEQSWLEAALLGGSVDYLPLICWRMRGAEGDLSARLEVVLADEHQSPDRRFRAALGLLGLGTRTASSEWTESEQQLLIEAILASDEFSRTAFLGLLKPMVERLRPMLEARLASISGTQSELLDRRLAAADFLLRTATGKGDTAFRLIASADASLFRILYHRCGQSGAELAMRAQVAMMDTDNSPVEPLRRARFRANCRLLLLLDALTSRRWPSVGLSGEELSDSLLVADAGSCGVTYDMLDGWLDQSSTEAGQRAILLAIGSLQLSPAERQSALSRGRELIQKTSDAGVYSAAVWLMRQLSEDSDDAESKSKDRAAVSGDLSPQKTPMRGWLWNSEGQMMSVVEISNFTAGLKNFDAHLNLLPDELPRKVQIRRRVAVSVCETTRGEWQEFLRDQELGDLPEPIVSSFSPDRDCPAISVSWFEAAQYCNWLSQREGIPEEQWCFQPNELGLYAEGMLIRQDAVELAGYRLPTEDEWEYFSGGSPTQPWFFGYSPENLAQYAWTAENSDQRSHPTGWLRPNQFGLFDVLGNAQEWCLDSRSATGFEGSAGKSGEKVMPENLRNCRGGGFTSLSDFCRSSRRFSCSPVFPSPAHGVRVVRTLSPEETHEDGR